MKQTPVEQLIEFLRFPSISTDSNHASDVARTAEWLREKLQSIGLTTQIFATEGHPIVVAKNHHREDRRTVLIYGHYDVQPVDPLSLWTHPPFEPHVENGHIFARGAADDKGQILAHVFGVEETLKRDGDLPVNLIFLIEGEEEIGSTHLEIFLREHRDELACDIIAISDSGMVAEGVPTFTYGLRGVAAMEIVVSGPAMDLHSGLFGGAVANPITELSRLLATLHDANGQVAVEGFYENVKPIQDWERSAWKPLPLNDESIQELTGVPELAGEADYTAIERISGRPTIELNGIGGGYQGEGSKTIIPTEAFAKITCRLVSNQTSAEILTKLRAHFERHTPRGVRVTLKEGHGGEPYAMNPRSANGEAAQRALNEAFGGNVALVRDGGSIPIVTTFQKILGAETLLLGLSLPDARVHSPNENFPIANFEAGIRLNQMLLKELSR